MACRAVHGWRHPLIPRGRERSSRGRRAPPPKAQPAPGNAQAPGTARGRGLWKARRRKACGTDGVRRASGGRPNLSGHRTEGGHGSEPPPRSRQEDTWPHRTERASRDPARRRCTAGSAGAWCPSRATPCRCSTRPASWPSTCTAAPRAALFDVSHMGQAELAARARRRRWSALTPADVQGLKPGRQRYGLLTTAAGGIFDDFMVANLGDRLFLVVNASRKDEDFALIEAALPAGVTLRPLPDRALLALAGAAGAWRRIATLAPGLAALSFMGVAETRDRRHSRARQPQRLHRRGRLRDQRARPSEAEALAEALLGPARRCARRPRRARLAAAGGRALPLRQRHRRDDEPGRGGADLDHRQAPPHGLGLPGRRAGARGAGQRRRRGSASASSPRAASPPARHTPIHAAGGGEPVGEVTSGGFGPSLGGPMAMGYVARDPCRRRHRARPAGARQAPCPPASPPCPSPPTATRARAASEAPHGRPAIHHRTMSGSAWTAATSPPSASPTTRRTRWATWSSSTCPRSGARWRAGEACAVVESVKAASDVYAPVAGRWWRRTRALADDPGLINSEPTGEGWFFRSSRRPGRARRADGRGRLRRASWRARRERARRSSPRWRTTATSPAATSAPTADEIAAMLRVVGAASLEDLAARTVPAAIAGADLSALPPPATEAEAIAELRALSERNARVKSLIGLGYHGTHVPPVILRNVLENPGWYTAYTPYQAEIAQGRLEALVNFQTMVADLTGLPVANASLLDEATAAAEAVALAHAAHKRQGRHAAGRRRPASADARRGAGARGAGRHRGAGRAAGARSPLRRAAEKPFAVLLQYPGTTGEVRDLAPEIAAAHEAGAHGDRRRRPALALPADAAGRDGRRCRRGQHPALRRAARLWRAACRLHGGEGRAEAAAAGAAGRRFASTPRAARRCASRCRRASSTSGARRRPRNICTAQVLLAVMAGMYAVWHGPEGLRAHRAARARCRRGMLADAAKRGRLRAAARRVLRHHRHRGRRARADALMRGGAGARLQPAPRGRRLRRHRAGRDGDARGAGGAGRSLRRGGGAPAAARRLAPAPELPAALARRSPFLHGRGVQQPPQPSTRCCATSSGWKTRTSR